MADELQETQVAETQQQDTIPAEVREMMEISLNGGMPPEAKVEEQQQSAGEAATVVQETVPFKFETFTEKFGYGSPEDAFREIEELREKAKNADSIQIEFPDETSERLFKAFQSGKLEEVHSYLDQHRQLERLGNIEVTDETADDIIKLGMKLEYKDLTPAEIDYKFRKSFSLPKEPVQGISEDEEDFEKRKEEWKDTVEDIKMNKIIEAKLMKPKLEQSKSKLTLPEIEKFADDGYTQYQKELEESIKSAEEAKGEYQKLTTKALETKMNFNDEANKISFDFQFEPDADSLHKTIELLSDPNQFNRAFVGQDGKPDRLKFAKVIHYGLNRERELMEAMKQAKNATLKSSLPDNAQGNGMVRQLPQQQQELSEFDKQMQASLAPFVRTGR